MVPEEEATGKVRDVYDDIKATLDIDFVPNLYKVMAPNPGYLEANWDKVKAHGVTGQARPPDQGDHSGRRVGSERPRLLTRRAYFCDAEGWDWTTRVSWS